jgi:hypothetical protein
MLKVSQRKRRWKKTDDSGKTGAIGNLSRGVLER